MEQAHQVLAQPIPDQTPVQPQSTICKKCSKQIWDSYFFCPNCGKKLKEPPYVFSLSKTIIIVLESLLLPPLGLIPGIRYLRMKESEAKLIGLIAIVLTIISTILTLVFLKDYIDKVNKQLNDVNYINNIYSNPQGSVEDQVNQLQNINQ